MEQLEIRNTNPDFLAYVQHILDYDVLTDKESGIAALMLDKGYDVLSNKQKYVFDKMIEEHSIKECSHCGQEIPWIEMAAAKENGGMCSWCEHMWDKLKKE